LRDFLNIPNQFLDSPTGLKLAYDLNYPISLLKTVLLKNKSFIFFNPSLVSKEPLHRSSQTHSGNFNKILKSNQ
jgi:hypothetical protein